MFPRVRVVPRCPERTKTTITSQSRQGNRRNNLYCRFTYLERACGCGDCVQTAVHSGRGSGPEVSTSTL